MLAIKAVHDILEQYHKQGRLVSRPGPSDPGLTEISGHYANNTLHFCFTLKDGRLHGTGRLWYDNGRLGHEVPFYKGILHGRERVWYPEGQLREEVHYTNNHFDGPRREWYMSAQIKAECHYVAGRLGGLLTEWHPNGQLKERVPYWEGERHGILKAFDEKGRSLGKEIFVRGARYTGKMRRLVNSRRISPERLARIESTAVRRFLLEEIGYERFLRELPFELLDELGELGLFRVDWHKEEEPLYLVKVRCPSTGTFYTLRVAPHVRSVREAVAWTFSLDAVKYAPYEET